MGRDLFDIAANVPQFDRTGRPSGEADAAAQQDLAAENPHLRVDSRRAVPLWDGPWALLLVILGLGGEVLLRRRAGLT